MRGSILTLGEKKSACQTRVGRKNPQDLEVGPCGSLPCKIRTEWRKARGGCVTTVQRCAETPEPTEKSYERWRVSVSDHTRNPALDP
jgi:hypothetical protein